MEVITKSRGGFVSFAWKLLEKEDAEARLAPNNIQHALCKTTLLVLCLGIWPRFLYDLLKSYYIGGEKYLAHIEEKYNE